MLNQIILPGSEDTNHWAASVDSGLDRGFAEKISTEIRSVAQGPPITPSLDVLNAHIADLRQDLRNFNFKLQYIYNQRQSTISLLHTARRQLDKLKK
jgi:hypothetical protein